MAKGMKCPVFSSEEHNEKEYDFRGLSEHLYEEHNLEQCSLLLADMIAKQTDMILRSKVAAKIAELETEGDRETISFRQHCNFTVMILKELLNDTKVE